MAFQAALQLDETVARIEHEQGRGNPVRQDPLSDLSTARPPRRWRPLLRADAPRIQGRHPRVALEGEPGDQLVGPPGDDGLPGGVPRRMVVVTSPGLASALQRLQTLTSTA